MSKLIIQYLEEVKKLEEAATPGPWVYDSKFGVKCGYKSRRDEAWTDIIAKTKHDWVARPLEFPLVGQEFNNGEFIAHARTDVPLLRQALEEALKALEWYATLLETLENNGADRAYVQITEVASDAIARIDALVAERGCNAR
jgi:hypothetical protein